MAILTVPELLTALKSLHLLSPQQANALAKEAMPADARAVARSLVQRDWQIGRASCRERVYSSV